MVRKSGWDAYREEFQQEGAVRARQETLLRQLRLRFKDVPAEMEAVIQRTADVSQLDEWLDQMATAKTLKEMGLAAEGEP
jgi:hypothetical protein